MVKVICNFNFCKDISSTNSSWWPMRSTELKIYWVRITAMCLIRRCHEDFKAAFYLKRFKSILPNSSYVKFDPANSSKWHLLRWQLHYDHICRINSPQCKWSRETTGPLCLTCLIYKLQIKHEFLHPAPWLCISMRSGWINELAANEAYLR